jgi:hypothetical protein
MQTRIQLSSQEVIYAVSHAEVCIQEQLTFQEDVTGIIIVLEETKPRMLMYKEGLRVLTRWCTSLWGRPRTWYIVHMMQMTMKERLIHQYEEYTREVDCMLKEVFMMHMEERLIYLYNRDTNLENMVVIEIEYNTAEMQKKITVKKGDINISEDIFKSIVELVRTLVIKMEYKTAEMLKKLTFKEGDINMSVEVVRMAIMEVVRTAITKGEDNAAGMQEEQTVQEEKSTRKRENFWSFRDIETRHSLI